MMVDKLLSISIAAYNAEKTLEKAVLSCIVEDKEMLEKLDIIIVNDGSEDGTYQISKMLMSKYNNVRIIDKPNGGYGSTVNAAIEIALGKYFKLLDSDDWYDTDNLLKLLYELEKYDSDMIVTNYTEVRDSGEILISYRDKLEICNNIIDLTDHFNMHGVAYKTDILKKNCIKLKEGILYTDTEFVTYPLIHVHSVTFFPYDVYQYSLYGEGQSVSISSRINHIKDAEMIVRNLEYFVENICKKENMTSVLLNKMVDVSKFYINSLLLVGSKGAKKELKRFDTHLKNEWNSVYKKSSNKIIGFLRNTHYITYGLCRLALKLTLK